MQFVIILNDLRGVELILRRLRESGCIASSDLANGIEANLHQRDDAGILTFIPPPGQDMVEHVAIPVTPQKKVSPFSVIQGGKK